MQRLELPIEDLDLDLKNPRIDEVENETDAINAIVSLDINHFCNMMESIRDHGLDPGDSFYIISENEEDNYTVVDGNRRLAALKMLRNPEKSKHLKVNASQAKRIAGITKLFDKKRHPYLDCVLFDSREQANSWILRRHGRGLDGEGRIPWGTLEIERFKQDGSVLDVIDFVERNLPTETSDWAETKKKLQRASSTLRRIIESKRGREWLGLTIEEINGARIPSFTLDSSAALRILQTIFSDIKSKTINTRSLNTSAEIESYLDKFAENIKPKPGEYSTRRSFKEAVVTAKGGAAGSATKSKASDAKSDKIRSAKVPSIRATLAPLKHNFKPPETEKGKQLLREASKLKLDDLPLSCAYVLRAFIEHTIDTYMTANKIPFFEKGNQLDLSPRADRVVNHLVQNGVPMKHLQGVRAILTSKSDPASIKSLNNYHHDHYQVPGSDILRKAWDAMEPLYVAVYGSL